MNLTVKTISKKLQSYKKIRTLYKSAFPRKERFPNAVLRMMELFKIIKALAFYDGNQLCGFSYLIVQEKAVFIMYLAVNDELRGKGYGSEILKCIKSKYPDKTIILDIEELNQQAKNYEQRIRRVQFYKRNGFFQTNLYFTMRGVRYEIMSADAAFTESDYNEFWKNVYKKRLHKRKSAEAEGE